MPSSAHDLIAERSAEYRDSPGRSLASDRARLAGFASMLAPPDGVTEQEVPDIPGSLLFIPPDARDGLVAVLIHGGGFRNGSPAADRRIAGHLALRSRVTILSPHYRLAPEHPYPAGLDDCERAYEWAAKRFPDARIAIGGGSAGAGLAAALLLRRRDAADPRPAAGLLFSGHYDFAPRTRGSWSDNAGTEAILGPADADEITRDYLGDLALDPDAFSPLAAELSGLPPLLLMASSAERLLDDTLKFAVKAARADVETSLEIWPGLIHNWQGTVGSTPEGDEAIRRAAAFLDRIVTGHYVDGPALNGS